MCYFTDENYLKKLKGTFDPDDLPLLANAVLSRALKFQIGCGTEPTLYKNLPEVIKIAKEQEVPHISLTTNGNLLTKEKINLYAESGLNEIILSLHGVNQVSYEDFMQRGDYKIFHKVLGWVTEVKGVHKSLSLRVNYTFNEDNFSELSEFFTIFGKYSIDTLQIRPITRLGFSTYQNFKMDNIIPVYDGLMQQIKMECKSRGITLLAAATSRDLIIRKNINSLPTAYSYCYISPKEFWHKDFDWRNETYDSYAKRKKLTRELLRNIFRSSGKTENKLTENLNYKIS
jgi:MoaA/NifB/PqqE/SkfB family radical SAM enzyme